MDNQTLKAGYALDKLQVVPMVYCTMISGCVFFMCIKARFLWKKKKGY